MNFFESNKGYLVMESIASSLKSISKSLEKKEDKLGNYLELLLNYQIEDMMGVALEINETTGVRVTFSDSEYKEMAQEFIDDHTIEISDLAQMEDIIHERREEKLKKL